MHELKPCPFCGKTPRLFELDREWFIACNGPYCIEQKHAYRSKQMAINMWNRRKGEVDEADIVQCRDCIFYSDVVSGVQVYPYCTISAMDHPQKNDFCSKGEMKDECYEQ